jgi:hypothetical protein
MKQIRNKKDNEYININNIQDNYIINDMLNNEDYNNIKECRICLDDEVDETKLIAPCKCKGTHKYVHMKCLEKWRHTDDDVFSTEIIHNRKKKCGICKTHYREDKRFPDETFIIEISMKKICCIYFFISFWIYLFITFFNISKNKSILYTYTNNSKYINMYRNITSSDESLNNLFIYSYSMNITNIITIFGYIYMIIQYINRYKIFFYKISPFLIYFLVYIFSSKIIFELCSPLSIHLFIFIHIIFYFVSPGNLILIKYTHNNLITDLNNKYNESTILPYDPVLSISDPPRMENGDNEDNNNDNENNNNDNENNNNDNENNNNGNNEHVDDENHDDVLNWGTNNNNNNNTNYVINIEEEINALGDISEEELFDLLKEEYDKIEQEKEKEKEEKNKDKSINMYSDINTDETFDTDDESYSSSTDYTTDSEEETNVKITQKIKSKYVVRSNEKPLLSINKDDEYQNKIIKNEDINIEMVFQKSKKNMNNLDGNIKFNQNNDMNLIDLDEIEYTNNAVVNTIMDTSEEFYKEIVKKSIDNTIDIIIKEALDKKYNETNESDKK